MQEKEHGDGTPGASLKVIIPPYIDLKRKRGRPKRVYLSFNVVKGLHWKVYNDIKHAVHTAIATQLDVVGGFVAMRPPLRVTLTLFGSAERVQDLDNSFISMKFCNDSVVELGYVRDDSVKYIKEVNYRYGGHDSSNPRCEILYEELK